MNVDHVLTLANSPLAQAVAALLVGLLGTVHRYRQTGKVPLAGVPWRALRRVIYAGRRRWFTVERPTVDAALRLVDRPVEDVRATLAEQSYNPGWLLSYHYYGEDLNARRYFYDPTRPHPHRQLHIRGFKTGEGVELVAHEEPAPEHHPRAHLKEVDMHDATTWVHENWDSKNLDPRGFERHT
ncbi:MULTISPECIES: hypothetical protein [Halorussus]|uniref:hypothetical protein n=1 Tax=Halorussus TaxID=1070314 RepID=UPI00209E59C4|nr:hypothetical protein [Halorussus vallis]USZ75649.1 hypothetical protein NGM07_19750 [Halorussus vallis]USZ75703.1 hypothetical protein NGM07_20025 [Halorussus vallis]